LLIVVDSVIYQVIGMSTAVLRWLQNYLTDRTHCVKSDRHFLPWARMKDGIPQGSALYRPTTFLDLYEYIAFYYQQWFIIAVCG